MEPRRRRHRRAASIATISLTLDKRSTLRNERISQSGGSPSGFKRTCDPAGRGGDESRAAGSLLLRPFLSLYLSPARDRQDRIHSLGSVCTARTSTCHN